MDIAIISGAKCAPVGRLEFWLWACRQVTARAAGKWVAHSCLRHFYLMKIVLASLLTVALLGGFASAARAEAVVEGTVQLPKAVLAPAARTRYVCKAPDNIGPPEPPVAVVYLE